MLRQCPVQTGDFKALRDILSADELEYVQKMAANRFDQINKILRELPLEMLLIIQ